MKIKMDHVCWRYLMEKANEVGCRGCRLCLFLPGRGLTIKKRRELRARKLLCFETELGRVGLAGKIGERALLSM
jgi:hypothetical protein